MLGSIQPIQGFYFNCDDSVPDRRTPILGMRAAVDKHAVWKWKATLKPVCAHVYSKRTLPDEDTRRCLYDALGSRTAGAVTSVNDDGGRAVY